MSERKWTTHHMGQSITGPLLNWNTRDWKRAIKWMTKDDGTSFTPLGLKQAFISQLAAGHEVIPIGSPCDNWDWKTGCKGHPMPADESAKLDKEFAK